MQALEKSPNQLAVVSRAVPTMTATQVLVRVHVAGVCRTDAAVARGDIPVSIPTILGHEASGTIVDTGARVLASRVGEHVAIWPFQHCNRCTRCLAREWSNCAHPKMLGVDHDGAFAEYIAVESDCALAHSTLSPRELAYAEPVCAALSVLRALGPGPYGTLALIGDNRIAQLTREIVGPAVQHHLHMIPIESLSGIEDDCFDTLIESSASAEVFAQLVRIAWPGVIIVLKSRSPRPVALDLRAVVQKELRLVAANYAEFSQAIQWLSDHRVQIQPLLGPVFALTQFEQAFARDALGEANKSFLAVDPLLADRW